MKMNSLIPRDDELFEDVGFDVGDPDEPDWPHQYPRGQAGSSIDSPRRLTVQRGTTQQDTGRTEPGEASDGS